MTKEAHVHHRRHRYHRHELELQTADRNVGGWERGARLFLGAASMAASMTVGAIWLRVLLGLVGAGGLLTSLGAYCPVNRRLGHDSYHHHDLS